MINESLDIVSKFNVLVNTKFESIDRLTLSKRVYNNNTIINNYLKLIIH